jgi:hypothetical protein
LASACAISDLDQKIEAVTKLESEVNEASKMERETGIGPATNSLEGCDSTTELLPLLFAFDKLNCTAMSADGPSLER